MLAIAGKTNGTNMADCNKSRRYFSNDYLTQSLMRFHLTKSLAKTQGSVYVHSNQQMIFNYFIYKQVKMKLPGLARLGQHTNS